MYYVVPSCGTFCFAIKQVAQTFEIVIKVLCCDLVIIPQVFSSVKTILVLFFLTVVCRRNPI